MKHENDYTNDLAIRASRSQHSLEKAEALTSQNPSFARDLGLHSIRTNAAGYAAKNRIAQKVRQEKQAPQ